MVTHRRANHATVRPVRPRTAKIAVPHGVERSSSSLLTLKASVKNLRLRRGGDTTYTLCVDHSPLITQKVVVTIAIPDKVTGITLSPTEARRSSTESSSCVDRFRSRADSAELFRFTIVHTAHSVDSVTSMMSVNVQIVAKQPRFVFCFGSGENGRLGIAHRSDKRDANAFTPTPLGSKWLVPAHVACGKAHTAIIDANAHLYCCGRGSDGQLGQIHQDNVKVATVVPKLMNMQVTHVSCGANHTLCIVNQTWGYAWGDNSAGQLGLNLKAKHQLTPSRIHGLSHLRKFVCGGNHSFAITTMGDFLVAGCNIAGQLGLGDTTRRSAFTLNPHLHHVESLASGVYHAIAHTTSPHGGVFVWGCGDNGRLGLGHHESASTPQPLDEFDDVQVRQIAAGGSHTALVTETGGLWMWGANAYGQLGDGLHTDRLAPHRLRMFHGKVVQTIMLGEWHSVALTDDGSIYAWGFGEEGQLGLGDDRNTSFPLEVTALSGTSPISVSCGATHTVVITAQEVSRRAKQEQCQDDEKKALGMEQRRLLLRKSMRWKQMSSMSVVTEETSYPKESFEPKPPPAAATPRKLPKRPQTARPHREEPSAGGCDHVVPWRERPLTSRTSVRTALRQEFHALSLLKRQISTASRPLVCEALARKEETLKAQARVDPFEALVSPPTTTQTPRRLEPRRRPQTALTSRNQLPEMALLPREESWSNLLADDDDDEPLDSVLEEEMKLGWD
ncbi:hypothetical protein AC1031_012908 [Aphanomyces cochlioides]|nr:hypothetical protein AC1031_012908 [Aphanomyces cochlioides]